MEEDVLKGKTLLVVDDEVDLRDIVASELEFMGAKVFQAENILSAQRVLASHKIDLIISDIRMPGGTGVDLLDVVKAKDVQVPPVILITGFADITNEDAFDKGAEALLNKPFKLDDLIKMAVRYTSPVEERFNHGTIETRKEVKPINGELKIGRGGVSLKLDTHGTKYEIGEVVRFNFTYGDKSFTGEGICRWFKPTDQGAQKATMGVEFLHLTPETLDHFKDYFEDSKVVPYIPSFS
ncbi:response regulator [Peredibacter starrii]|uniref:Response regulator n=1 Tax=Peredibacter starrii TaxID=28202 RepID=A0AAX4HVA2_9BACT|nr:response regulator [Peredibacter starrii]WPU67092.1 response regulator [Peredibacter starrii]